MPHITLMYHKIDNSGTKIISYDISMLLGTILPCTWNYLTYLTLTRVDLEWLFCSSPLVTHQLLLKVHPLKVDTP